MKNAKIGFVGLGHMGFHMVGRLLQAGHRVTVFDPRQEPMAALEQQGAAMAGSLSELAASADHVLVSLDVVRSVAIGPAGLLQAAGFATYIDLSTTGPAVSQEVAAKMAEAGIDVLDCPVSGGEKGARLGTLAVMVSGGEQVYQRAVPILSAIGQNLFYVGAEPGQAQVMKLVNNIISSAAMAATAEAMVLGVKAGLDASTMIAVLNASTARNTHTEDKFPRCILPRKFDYGFTTGLLYKDIKLCLEAADRLGVPMWMGHTSKQLWGFAVSQAGPDKDMTTLIQQLERWAGVTVESEEP
jgi:3-hydroxyisobutyrate dehydrogenase-like beta-hydroxyacid dehydrogenase